MPGRKRRSAEEANEVRLACQRTPGLRTQEVKRRIVAMLRALKLSDVELSVLLTDDIQMRELNRRYRKRDRTTDVLAFEMPIAPNDQIGPIRAHRLLGDVVVSVPTARAQAKAAGRSTIDEVTMLLAHGLLHLLGWDHLTPREDRAMRAEVERLCRAAGKDATPRAQRRHTGRRKLS